MLYISLRFPHLDWLETVSINTKDDEVPLFVANWLPIDQMHNGKEGPRFLPADFENVISGPFAIPGHYQREIQHYCITAAAEAARIERRFDTMLRDVCFKPTVAAVNAAFTLLADCAYDPKKGYWDRSAYKRIRKHAMLWKFWAAHTGRGLVWEFAEMDRLDLTDPMSAIFVKACQGLQSEWEKFYERPSTTGPVIGEKMEEPEKKASYLFEVLYPGSRCFEHHKVVYAKLDEELFNGTSKIQIWDHNPNYPPCIVDQPGARLSLYPSHGPEPEDSETWVRVTITWGPYSGYKGFYKHVK